MTTRALSEGTETRPTRWLTLGEACKLLGVNESTLRRWADAGHVRSFRTPGGHRRFSEEDLRALIEGHTAERRASYRDLGQLALARIRRRLQRGRAQAAEWYTALPESARERLRPLGRRLVALVSDYLGRGSQRSRLLDEARDIALEYGRELRQDGLPLKTALEAFVFFRRGLTDSAVELCQRNNLSAEEAVEVWDLLSSLADQVLLSLAEAYSEDGQRD